MSLFKQINERLQQQFEDAKVKGAHQFAPRDGYYHIKEVYYKFIGSQEIPVATANWKATLEEAFIEEMTFEIALLNIRSADNENSVVCYPGLVGLTIKIYDSAILNLNDNGVMKKVFRCKYVVLAITSVFWSNSDLLIMALGGPGQNFNSAYQKQINDQGIDLSDFFDEEAKEANASNEASQNQ